MRNLDGPQGKSTKSTDLVALKNSSNGKTFTLSVGDLMNSQAVIDLIDANVSAIGAYPAGTKIYRALLTQVNPSNPTAVVLENTLGGTLVWTRNSNGDYTGTLAGAFADATKVMSTIINSSGSAYGWSTIGVATVNTVAIYTSNSSGLQADNRLTSTTVEIIVYP